MSRPHLRLESGDARVVLTPDEVGVLGRASDCTMRIDDARVSRHHAQLTLTDDGWLLEDLASSRGIWLASDRVERMLITESLELRLADPVSGPSLRLEPQDPMAGEPDPETQVLERAGRPVSSRRDPASTPARPPSGDYTLSYTPGEKTRIGRAADNDIVVDDLLVSRYHAELHATNTGFEILDVGSRNGTFVNGQSVRRAVLHELDLIAIGHDLFRLFEGRLEEYRDSGEVTFEAVAISASTGNGHTLYDDISFSLNERTLLAVVGPSGSGKSSLLAALAGLRPADEGQVLYGGRDLYDDYAELQNRIGFVPQEDVLHRELTVRSTLEYAGRLRFPADVTAAEAGARIDDLLAELGIAHRDQAPLNQLSGGERKRTNVVSELLTEPSLLFLDEPTSGLDPGISRVLMQKLRDLADGGRTIVVVTHELANLDVCDQLLVLASGGVPAYFGPPDGATHRFEREDLSDVFIDLAAEPADQWRVDRQAASLTEPTVVVTHSAPPEIPHVNRRNWWSQVATLSARNLAVLAADRRNAALLLLQAPILGLLLLAALPPGELAPTVDTEVRIVSVAGLVLFVVVLAVTWVGANNSTREIARELPILRRERAVGLSLSAYVTAKALVLSGLTIVQSVVLVSLAIGRQQGPVSAVVLGWGRGELIVVVTLAGVAAMALGLFVSAMAGSPERASSLLPLVLILQLLLSAGIILPEIVDKPVLREAAVISSAQWGVAGAASTTDINQLQIFDDRLRELRTVDSEDPGPAIEVLTRDAQPEQRWEHTRQAWFTAVLALLALIILPLVATHLRAASLRSGPMSDSRRARLLVLIGLVGAAIGLLIAALQPGSVDAEAPLPGFGPGPVSPGTPVTSAWGDVAGLVPGIDPDSANDCQAGRVTCLVVVVEEMDARLEQLGCGHTAPFAFTYLETTRGVSRGVADPDFFVEPPVVAQLDALFARLYFDAIDNWEAGRHDDVPAAWRIAFQAADEGRTSAAADIFLGMNAHITRDLAYAVAQVAGADTGMLSDATDYLLVNEVIAEVQGPLLADASERYDPRLSDLASLVPAAADLTSVELIARWRQQSFDLGLRLATATSAEESAAIVAEIERNAVAGAVLILNADSSAPVEDQPLDRDEYCESRR